MHLQAKKDLEKEKQFRSIQDKYREGSTAGLMLRIDSAANKYHRSYGRIELLDSSLNSRGNESSSRFINY